MPCQSLAVTVTLDQLSESDRITRKLGNDSDFRRQEPPPQSGWQLSTIPVTVTGSGSA